MNRSLIVFLVVSFALAMVSARLMNVRNIPSTFELLERADGNQPHEFRLALKQKNVDVLEATLLDVSDPESVNYGKWWTPEQILDLIAPSEEEVKPVVAWLKAHGVEHIDVSGRDFIKAVAPIHVIERMFYTQMHQYRSLETGKVVVRAFDEVHIPDHLEIVDMIMGLTELVPKSYINRDKSEKRAVEQNADPLGIIYPGILRKMYQIPAAYPVNKQSSFGVIEFQGDASYNQQDLTSFNQQMNEKAAVTKIVGTFSPDSPDGESTLDVQYGAAIALNTTFWFWTVDQWMYEFATQIFNAKNYPLVVSMSWGWPEDAQCQITGCTTTQQSFDYVNKVNVEFTKLGLKGITLLAASGDQGAPGDEDTTCAGTISNIFPGGSPWVTSVGATMLVSSSEKAKRQSGQPPVCQQTQCATTITEGVCTYPTALITTGGGFSNVSKLPAWQKDYVNAYLQVATNLPTGQFDPTRRAFPDVSANGHNYGCILSGTLTPVDGTSASTPVFGGIISLLNSYMFNNGKSQIGFANPLLYKMYAADKTTYTDITSGNNYCTEQCCGTAGFVATKGWDAVTGLGTPMFPKMQAYLKKNVVEKN